jgi:hypothetical protein
MNMKRIKTVATEIAATLVKRYGYYTDDKPFVEIVSPTHARVAWNGPTDWATNDPYWLFEEVASMMVEFTGEYPKYDAEKYKPFYDEFDGYEIEAETGYSISIRRAA